MDAFFAVYEGKGDYIGRQAPPQSEEHGFNLNIFAPGDPQTDDQLPVLVSLLFFQSHPLPIHLSSIQTTDHLLSSTIFKKKIKKLFFFSGFFV